jgi:hypothetical protein
VVIALVAVAWVVGLAIDYWYIAVPTVILAIAISVRLSARSAAKKAEHHQEWLSGPAPVLTVPSRFTAKWISENVPYLHPGQVPVLVREMQRRGWSDEKIAEQVMPYRDA